MSSMVAFKPWLDGGCAPGASDDVSVGNILDTCQLVAKCV